MTSFVICAVRNPLEFVPMRRRFNYGFFSVTAFILVFSSGVNSSATTLYSEDFDVDPTASWTVNDPAVTDTEVSFFYDYSAIGVPAAPGSSTTTGLKMTANNSSGVFGGFSVSPTGESFSGDYKVQFQFWQNYVGPLGPGGSGTTQLSMMGIGTAGNVGIYPGVVSESVMFGVTLDGGSAADFRAYSSAAVTSYPSFDPVYQAVSGSRNGSDSHYAGFGGASAPLDQVTLYPGQTGTTSAGEPAFVWQTVTIDVIDDVATWSIDGIEIAKVNLTTVTLGGGNILFGHSDTNNSSSSDPNDSLLNVTLIDNVVVTAIPEPASALLLGLASLGLVARRR